MSAKINLKNALRPAWHAVKEARLAVKRAYGARLSHSSETDCRKVVLSCNFGRGYLCNPKYIAEALNRLYPGEFDLVLLVRERDSSLPDYLRQVRYGSRDAQRELATARFWIYNFRNDEKFVPKRDDQVYIQTWHGSIGPKRIEADVASHLSPSYVEMAKEDGANTSLMFANNDLYESIYRNSFWYEGPVIRCGAPRNSPLMRDGMSLRRKVHATLGVPDGTGICLYAPTFRVDSSMDAYMFDYDALTAALEKRFGRPFAFAYRLHPNIAADQRPDFFKGRVDATGYEDSQELLAGCDVVITDYSSILEDFMLTGRPGFVYAPDIDAYAGDRGFYYPLSDRPFPLARNGDELIRIVGAFNEIDYARAVRRFCESVGLKDNGGGAETVAEIIHGLAAPKTTVRDVLGNLEIAYSCKE